MWNRLLDYFLGKKCPHGVRNGNSVEWPCRACHKNLLDQLLEMGKQTRARERQARVQEIAEGIQLARAHEAGPGVVPGLRSATRKERL